MGGGCNGGVKGGGMLGGSGGGGATGGADGGGCPGGGGEGARTTSAPSDGDVVCTTLTPRAAEAVVAFVSMAERVLTSASAARVETAVTVVVTRTLAGARSTRTDSVATPRSSAIDVR